MRVSLAFVALVGCGSVAGLADAQVGADATTDARIEAPFDIAYVWDFPVNGTDAWSPGIALIINTGSAPLDLSQFSWDMVTDDHATIVFDFTMLNLTPQVPPGQAAGTTSGAFVDGLLNPIVPETRFDATAPLFGFSLYNYPAPTVTTVLASVRVHNATQQATLDFTLNVDTGGTCCTGAASRVSSVPY